MFKPVSGFSFSAASARIRKDGRIDVALAVADADAVASGLFTRNLVRAAPVELALERIRSGRARAVLANSGCANACTGTAGFEAAQVSTAALAQRLGIGSDLVLPASTGVIGQLLPAERIRDVSDELVHSLSPEGFSRFAEAICTTDRWPKLAQAPVGSGSATVLGIAKGAGMIHPDVAVPGELHATMLVFLFTDALVTREDLDAALAEASDQTFNACSVDGDTSTNDTVLALASGHTGERASRAELASSFREVCAKLARSMVADGEGSNHVAEILVRGLTSRDEARQVARTVATSLLVKTALFGKDANWGRLLAAAGRSGVRFDPRSAEIRVGDIVIVKDGMTLGKDIEAAANRVLQQPEYRIELVLGSGSGEFSYLTSDLGHGYVDVNAGYRS